MKAKIATASVLCIGLLTLITPLALLFWPVKSSGTQYCVLPSEDDPFSARAWMSSFSPSMPGIECQAQPVASVEVRAEGGQYLRVRLSQSHFSCSYRELFPVDDNFFKLGLPVGAFNLSEDLGAEWSRFLLVTCTSHTNHSDVRQEMVITMPALKNHSEASSSKPSVLILGVESLTRWNFERSMPRTVQALNELGPELSLKGFTRIADNTFPNMLALLTGRLEQDYSGAVLADYYDSLPFVWKVFRAQGYSTALVDDDPPVIRSTLNYQKKGFLRAPTTFYPHAWWNFMRRSKRITPDFCVGGQPVPQAVLAQVQHFLEWCELHSSPYLVVSMNIFVTHNNAKSNAPLLDQFYAEFLRANKHRLRNTVVIMLGDHGDRYSPLSFTPPGQTESRLPLLTVRVPGEVRRHLPHIAPSLELNQHKLATALDVHRMLLDLALSHTAAQQRAQHLAGDGKVFSPASEVIPSTRTCSEARIPDLYCLCQLQQVTEVEPNLTQQIATRFVQQLTSILPPDLCEPLQLKRVHSALLYRSPGLLHQLVRTQNLELVLEVSPSGAIFRTSLRQNLFSQWSPVTRHLEIERLNLYGNQSACIDDRTLRKYCFCKD